MNTNRTNIVFRVLLIFAFVLGMILLPRQSVKAQNPSASIRAILHPYGHDQIVAMNWPLGVTLTLEIDDPSTPFSPDHRETQIATSQVWFGPWEDYDMRIGDIITVSGGGITRTHTVLDVVITSIDIEADVVSGTAGPDTNQVQVSLSASINRWVDVVDGFWSADFSVPGDLPGETATCDMRTGDLMACDGGNAILYEGDGDRTTAHWNLPVPWIQVEPDQGWIDVVNWLNGLNLPSGIPLTLTVDDDTDPDNGYIYRATQQTGPPHQPYLGVCGTIFHVEQDDPTVDLLPGQYVTVTHGSVIKTTRIQTITFDFINETNDTAGGIGPAGGSASVWIKTSAGDLWLDIVIGSDGHWLADFGAGGQDIQTAQEASIIVYEEALPDEDATIAFWRGPAIGAITASVAPVQLGQSIDATAEFNDPDVGDSHSVLWDWGDGSTTTAHAAVPSVTTSHTYATSGVFTITSTITDAAGKAVSAAFQYVVVYDPEGGFVTGGGWIISPLGAYTPDLTLSGKATFGFVSKYQKGADIPTGNTEFQFHAADMNFRSTSYEWLVVGGTRAQYKGTGTINSAGSYGFMLTAIDGTPDKFRIKIWDKATGNVIYDNMLDAADTSNPNTSIEGGSIFIHRDK